MADITFRKVFPMGRFKGEVALLSNVSDDDTYIPLLDGPVLGALVSANNTGAAFGGSVTIGADSRTITVRDNGTATTLCLVVFGV